MDSNAMVDVIRLYGEICTSVGSCDNCLVNEAAGELSCAEFAKLQPNLFLNALKRMKDENYSYYNEFCNRMTNCELSVEDLADTICRKVAFQGYVDCEGGDCVACWNKKYDGDIDDTEAPQNIEQKQQVSLDSLSSLGTDLFSSTENTNKINMDNITALQVFNN